MARIFDAATGKICRKDVRKKMRNRLLLKQCEDVRLGSCANGTLYQLSVFHDGEHGDAGDPKRLCQRRLLVHVDLANLMSCRSPAISSTSGETIWHGPHQSA